VTSLSNSLNAVVTQQLSDEVVNCLVRVEWMDGRDSASGAAGRTAADSPRALSADDPFRIASVTKTFTATLIMQLVEEGHLRLDDAAIEFLDVQARSCLRALQNFGGEPHGGEVTIRQLLTHAAGLFDYASAPEFFAELAEEPGRRWSPLELLEGAIAWGAPHFEPGGGYGYSYSDTGYVLLGLVIENILRQELHVAYRERILNPVGLHETYLEGYEEHRGPVLSHAYQGAFDVMAISGTADWAGGGLVSTARDLASFARALFVGDLLSPEALLSMLRWDFRALDPLRHTPGYLGYGLGVEARKYGSHLWRGHRGHWGVLFHVEPVSGLILTGTINQASVHPDAFFHATLDSLGYGPLVGEVGS